jgi:hypothetical protein
MYIREVCSIGASDEQFAEKMYRAIVQILTGGSVKAPVVSSLSPNTVVIGAPSFDIHVVGEFFTPGSKIVFNGYEEPTVFVSQTELTTGVNMPLWLAPAIIPVNVLSEDGIQSNAMSFAFTDTAVVMSAQKPLPGFKEPTKSPTPVVAAKK